MSEFENETIETLLEVGKTIGAPFEVPGGNLPFAVIPQNCKLESLEKYKFNEYSEAPQRIKARVSVLDPDSFVEYYKLFADEQSRVFADEPNINVVGVLDYHKGEAASSAPRWCQHRVILGLRASEQWNTWLGQNNKQQSQQQFSEFLEQNAIDIIKPAPASIVEVARDLQATTEVEFGAGFKNENGQTRLKYTETTKATVGGGEVAVPDRFTIEIPVFVGGQDVQLDALLRFRQREGKLTFWFTLVRPEEAKRAAFTAARDRIAEVLGIRIINGVPQS
jgi:uncharacterized protein YfdQ (DUF2303 family)